MRLDQFSYYFSIKGSAGGIFNLTFDFCSDNINESGSKVDKKTVKRDFEQLETLLEEHFLSNPCIRGCEKKPILTDSPASLETGYEYRGHGRGIGVGITASFLDIFSALFFLDRFRDSMKHTSTPDCFTTQSAKLLCRMNKRAGNQALPVLKLEVGASHDLNLSIFEKILAFPGLNISPTATIEIQNLRQILAMGKQIDPKKRMKLEE